MGKRMKTAFPAGRIKKIMLLDEDVGKMAAAVPVVISKCVELFLQDLCKHLTAESQENGTVSPAALKRVLMREKSYDFLRHLVENVSEIEVEKKGKGKASGKGRGKGKGKGKAKAAKREHDGSDSDFEMSDEAAWEREQVKEEAEDAAAAAAAKTAPQPPPAAVPVAAPSAPVKTEEDEVISFSLVDA